MPDQPPRPEDIEETIDAESEVDEASLESFPASDAPSYSATYTDDEASSDDDGDDDTDD